MIQIIFSNTTFKYLDHSAISKLVKLALPYRTEFIDKHGESGYYYLLEELEERLLDELLKMYSGIDMDKESLKLAADIIKISKEIYKETNYQVNSLSSLGLDHRLVRSGQAGQEGSKLSESSQPDVRSDGQDRPPGGPNDDQGRSLHPDS